METLDDIKKRLTRKRAAFADEYIISLNATQAAIKAGYSEKYAGQNADKLLKNTNVSKYIELRLAEKEKSRIASQDEVLEYLTKAMRRQEPEHVVVTVQEETSAYVPDEHGTMRKQTIKTEKPVVQEMPTRVSDSNKAAELLGKRYKLFTDKTEISGAVPIVISGEDEILE